MKELFQHKKHITNYINKILDENQKRYEKHYWTNKIFPLIKDLATSGKQVRGCLIVHTAKLLGRAPDSKIYEAAAALEIYHTSILIHDDFMDKDVKRRGKPTIHKVIDDTYKDSHFANSIAVTAGDLGYFIAMDVVSEISSKETLKTLSAMSKDFIPTCLAQMDDVYFSQNIKEVSKERILEMYRYKTARYTFSLPFKMGCIIAKKESIALEDVGETIGIIFQIKDDEIGLVGDVSKSGKSNYADIIENKQTLHRKLAKQRLDEKTFDKYFGKNITNNEAKELRKLLKENKVIQEVQDIMNTYAKQAKKQINELSVSNEHKKFLEELLHYNLTRQK